ncbi:MAG: hypothetical protein JNK08_09630 [Sediminibacterium sp.]|nr:hypothetical protein [Sediminibacterium sp.]
MSTNSCNSTCPTFSVLRGGKADDRLDKLSCFAWSFTCTLLFPHLHFSFSETSKAKDCIKHWILLSTDSRKGFLEYVERLLLCCENGLTPISMLPSNWLSTTNLQGFILSGLWMENIKKTRYALPAYREDIRSLAEAVLEISEHTSENNFRYWRHYFISHQQWESLQLLTTYTCNHFLKIY